MYLSQVMPKLKPLFSEWEHKWWPKPMPAAERSLPLGHGLLLGFDPDLYQRQLR